MKAGSGQYLSLAAGILLDYGLQRQAGLREKDAEYFYGAQGKPYLANAPDVNFNLSHSGNYGMAAVAPVEIGCDIQHRALRTRQEQVAKRFFSEQERQALEGGCDFFRIWALKESFLKVTGQGMALGLDTFSVVDAKGRLCLQHQKTEQYQCEETVIDEHRLAVCYANAKELPVEWVRVDFRQLLKEEF